MCVERTESPWLLKYSHVHVCFVLLLDGAHLYTMFYLPPFQSDNSQEVVDSLKHKIGYLENRLEKVRLGQI